MNACITIINSSNIAVSVYADDFLLASLLPDEKSICKTIPSGSVCLKVYDSRDKVLFDVWLSIKPNTRHLLQIYNGDFSFKSIPLF